MARATEPAYPVSPSSSQESVVPGHVCPFCGLTREITPDFDASAPCPRCTMSDTATTRGATKARVGPWHVRQVRNPWAPGMRFETLLALVKRGQVTKDSIVRGPTTHQLWKRAAEVKGLSREFGVCFSCGTSIEPRDNLCTQCNRLQEPPVNPDVLVETRDGGEAGPANNPREARGNGHDPDHAEPPPQANLPGPRPGPRGNEAVDEEQAARARQITSRPPAAQRKGAPDPQRPPKPRPVAIRPTTPGSEDALLTPQELAAAFQLDFSPDHHSTRRRRRRLPRWIAAVLIILLLAGAVAAAGYYRPDYRRATLAWSTRTYAQVKDFIIVHTTSPRRARPPVRLPAEPASVGTGRTSSTARSVAGSATSGALTDAKTYNAHKTAAGPTAVRAAATPVDVVITPTAPTAPPAGKSASNKADSPVAGASAGPGAQNPGAQASGASAASAQVAPRESSSAAQGDGAKSHAAAAGAASNDPYAQAKRLWGLAIDAEANQDYAGAVSYYEQIKKLPEDVHPWGLDERLQWALKRAK